MAWHPGGVAEPGTLRRAVLVGVLLASLVVLFLPGPEVPATPGHTDKLVHAGLFAVLAVAVRGVGVRPPATAARLAGYAVVSEVLQAVLPLGRDGSVGDALTDGVGVLLGLAAVGGWGALRRRRAGAPSGAPGRAGRSRR